jgi:dihydrofolate reductase
MKVIAIAAVGKNGVIGRGSELPWDIPEDMRFFRESTRGQIVVMGRKTYDSLGKALPARRNAVITRNTSWTVPDAEVYSDLSSALKALGPVAKAGNQDLFVIGGAEIYGLSLPFLDEVWLTEIDSEFEGDVFFPQYRDGCFEAAGFVRSEVRDQREFSSPHRYRFCVYRRRPVDKIL